MQISSIEFIFGENENAEDLEEEDDRYEDRRIVIKYRDRYECPCEATLIPVYGGYISQGNGNELTPESCPTRPRAMALALALKLLRAISVP
jgi:hypothetical protein